MFIFSSMINYFFHLGYFVTLHQAFFFAEWNNVECLQYAKGEDILVVYFSCGIRLAGLKEIKKKLTACEQDQDGTSWSCSQAVSKPAWHTPLLCVQWKTPDDGQRNCPKHVEFYSKNKYGKLMHLVGFIVRIDHDARSPERQIRFTRNVPYIFGRFQPYLKFLGRFS